MLILGISAYYHDSAAVIIKDGQVISAAEEERFSRIKHDNSFPLKAIEFCLSQTGVSIDDIDYIAYYEKPLLKFERILEIFVQTYPYGLKPFLRGIPEWLNYKIKVEETIRKKLNFKKDLFFIPHHLSHATLCYYSSTFEKSAILTIDGVGEYQTTGLWLGNKNQIIPLKLINFPHSLGLFYSTFTSFLGFKINEDEYKVMGLAAYGKPNLVDKIYKVINIKEDGSFNLNLKYFSFRESFQMFSNEFIKLFGKARKPEEEITEFHANLAASLQKVTEEVYFKILNYLYSLTKIKNLCISGGVALNALANGKIYNQTPFKNVWVFGAAGDNGCALGAAFYTYQILTNKRAQSVKTLSLGSFYKKEEIKKILKKYNLKYIKFKDKEELINRIAELLKEGKIVGWFQGKMEFGPRALGNRSILARPWPKNMKDKVNQLKKREKFRPFAASVLQDKVADYFQVPENNHFSPFMTFCFLVKREKREKIPAVVHVDGTCRIQIVNKDNDLYYELIKKFYCLTGIACILNTSFNLKGEPIVENPQQAIEDFLKTKMDYLVMERFLVLKT